METTAQRYRKHITKEVKFYIFKVLAIALLFFVAILMLFPYLFMVSNSFKSSDELVQNASYFYFIPKDFAPQNYIEIFEHIPLGRGFLNTFIIEVLVLGVGTFTTSLAAFAFSRLQFYGKNVIFYILLSGMMIPFVATFVPIYDMWVKMDLFDSLWPLIIPGLFGNVSMLFFLKQYADSIPKEIYEAAEVNGAGFFRVYAQLFLPLVKPALLAQVIFWFLGIWNDFFGPDIYLPTLENKTVQVMIKYYSASSGGTGGEAIRYQNLVMASSVLSSLPTLAIYIIFQKHFVKTFMLSGSKH